MQRNLVRLVTRRRQGVVSKLPQRLPHLFGGNLLPIDVREVFRQEAANDLRLFKALLTLQSLLQGTKEVDLRPDEDFSARSL